MNVTVMPAAIDVASAGGPSRPQSRSRADAASFADHVERALAEPRGPEEEMPADDDGVTPATDAPAGTAESIEGEAAADHRPHAKRRVATEATDTTIAAAGVAVVQPEKTEATAEASGSAAVEATNAVVTVVEAETAAAGQADLTAVETATVSTPPRLEADTIAPPITITVNPESTARVEAVPPEMVAADLPIVADSTVPAATTSAAPTTTSNTENDTKTTTTGIPAEVDGALPAATDGDAAAAVLPALDQVDGTTTGATEAQPVLEDASSVSVDAEPVATGETSQAHQHSSDHLDRDGSQGREPGAGRAGTPNEHASPMATVASDGRSPAADAAPAWAASRHTGDAAVRPGTLVRSDTASGARPVNVNTIDLDLFEEGLGPLRLRALARAGSLHVSLAAADPVVRGQLLDHAPELRAEITSAGIDLGSLDVGSFDAGSFRRNGDAQDGHGQQDDRPAPNRPAAVPATGLAQGSAVAAAIGRPARAASGLDVRM